ncbi:MAG: hypothetical protein FWD19_05330 [Defluviitaleaceae bacterium]|nr:hypothetical protein [Defluviitaleaceae bacterium]
MHNELDKLIKCYEKLNFSQKKEFIFNLKKNLPTPEHEKFLRECVVEYNAEVRARNKAAGFEPKPKFPDISPETFAYALNTLIHGGAKSGVSVKSKLLGTWKRDPEDGDFFYKFNDDGSFETNEFDGEENGVLVGNFSVGTDNIVLMEPHEKLRFTSLMFSQTGLVIAMKDGLSFEYKKV